MLIVALVVFLLLFFTGLMVMLRRIMTRNVALATQHLDELNQDYAKKEEELDKQLAQAKSQSQEIVAKAQEEAVRVKEQALAEAQEQSRQILEGARQQSAEMIEQADKSRQALLGEMQDRISKEAVRKAAELISYALPEKFRQDVHSHWVEELIGAGFHHLERLHLPQELSEVVVSTAFALTDGQRSAIAKQMKDAFGRNFTITEVIKPEICAGIVISIGSIVLDGSLTNKIQEIAKNAKRTSQ